VSPYGNFRVKARPATIGDNTIKGLLTGKKLRIVGGLIVASGGANTVVIKSSAANTIFSFGAMAANAVVTLPFHDNWEMGFFETNAGEDLIVNLSAATIVEFQLVGFAV
jgi:hypothetical protein